MANFRKNIRFTDVCEKFTNSSEMDFSEWFDKAQYAFEAMGVTEHADKVSLLPVYMMEPAMGIAQLYVKKYKEDNDEPSGASALKAYYKTLYKELEKHLKEHPAVGGSGPRRSAQKKL